MGQAPSSSSSYACSSTFHNTLHEICQDFTLSLPDECLATIFNKLINCHDRNSCSLVCKRWKYVESISRNRLVLLSPSEMSSYLPNILSRFSSLSILSLKCSRKHVSIDDVSFSCIPLFLPSLHKLKLKGCIDISDDGLLAFSLNNPISLTKISFASCGFGAKGLNSLLTNCPSLQHLTLKRIRKLDAHNTPIFDIYLCPKIERLCIKDLHNARIFMPLISASANALKTLIVCRSSGNWDKVFQNLQDQIKITSISEIQIENVQMGDTGLIAISSTCPQLQVLQLSRATDCTDDGLSAIATSCKHLRKLHIDAWSRFGGRTIGNEGVLSVANHCFKLQELVLTGVPITSSSLNILSSNCKTLERLALCNSDTVGDAELCMIATKFITVKKLCIKNCPISELGIEAIGNGCPNLVKLKVKRCKGISEASVRKLRMLRSSVVVSVDNGSIMLLGQRIRIPLEDDEEFSSRNRTQSSGRRGAEPAATSVICSSRSAFFFRSKFENAFQFGKRRSC